MQIKCSRCGKTYEIDDSKIGQIVICEKCYTAIETSNSNSPNTQIKTNPNSNTEETNKNETGFSESFRDTYKGILIFSMIIMVIVFTIIGYNVGNTFNSYRSDGKEVIGAIIGFLVGVFNAIIWGGLLVTIIKIGEDTQKIADVISRLEKDKTK